MAVYEHTYRPYTGELTAEPSRIAVFPRYAYEEVLRSKLFLAFIVVCLLWPFALAFSPPCVAVVCPIPKNGLLSILFPVLIHLKNSKRPFCVSLSIPLKPFSRN